MSDDWPEDYGERFWREYPRKVAKKAALRALEKVRKSGEVSFEKLIFAVKQFRFEMSRSAKDMQFIPHPATWLNGGRWDDDADAISGKPQSVADVFARLGREESEDIGWVLPQIGRG